MLRGWKFLPYAIQNRVLQKTVFFLKPEWELILKCDGKTLIDTDSLTGNQKEYLQSWQEKGYIQECEAGTRQLLPLQEYRFHEARFKESVQLSITGKCNYKCRHCFMSAPHGLQGEPTIDQIVKMLDAFERCGVRNIGITGGEPLIRKDFWQIVDEILRRDMHITTIYTNGHLLGDDFIKNIEDRRIKPLVQFSFDGVGYHDFMRGVEGATQRVTDAIRRCRANGLLCTASMVACKENIGSIRDTVNFLASLGVMSLKVNNAYPQGEWKDQKEHWLRQEELYEAFLEYIPHYYEDGCPLTIDLEGFFNCDRNSGGKAYSALEKNVPGEAFSKVLMCGHVRREMYVSPQGRVLPCMSMVGMPIEDKFPNMLETPLEDILDKDSLYMDITSYHVSDFMESNPECRTCEYRNDCCGGCRSIALRYEPDNYLGKDLITCDYYKGGWKAKKDALMKSLGVL